MQPDTGPANGRARHRAREFKAWLVALPRWQRGLLLASALCVVVGGTLWLVQGGSDPAAAQGGGGAGGGATALLPENRVPRTGQPMANEEPAAKGVFRLGFSFLAGFSVGAFLRAAIKLASIVLGFFIVAMVLLEYAGFVSVDWNAIDAAWDGFWSHVGEEWGDFQRFLTGRLPAAGLASVGLYAGFRRR